MIIESKLHSDEKYKEYNTVHWYMNIRPSLISHTPPGAMLRK